MSSYLFQTDKFGITDQGIHLLRGRYNYETIEYLSIDEIVLDKGHQINNWILSLIIGMALCCAPLVIIWFAILKEETHLVHMGVALTILPLFLGAYIIYFSLKIGFVLRISIGGKIISFPIEQLKKKSQIGELIKYLNNNRLTKYKIRVNFVRPLG